MKKLICPFILFFIFAFLLAGCGPSDEEIATMTAAAWTPTPSPTPAPTSTPIPTPIPYDLTISVKDKNGNLIDKASIVFPASGDDEPIMTDASGKFSWTNLPGEEVSLTVSAQGYYDSEEKTTIARGSNDISVTMERDPFQLLPSEACQPGQELLYLEDFEDGQAQAWEGIARPVWMFKELEGRGTILTANPSSGETRIEAEKLEFNNAVWHMDIRRNPIVEAIWLRYIHFDDEGYIAVFAEGRRFWIQREGQDGFDWPTRTVSRPDGETWEKLSFSVFDGVIDVWIDGILISGVNDPNQFEFGGMSITMTESEESIAFDNLVVCSLTEPYVPLEQAEE